MAADVSARPANLKNWVTAAAGIRDELNKRITTLRSSYDQYQQSGSPYIGNPDLLDRAIPQWLLKLGNDEAFVQLVALAFEQADSGVGGVSAPTAAEFNAAFAGVLAANGITPEQLKGLDGAITVDDAIAAGIPRTSGFVADPVCTATGHFLEAEDDFVWPARLEVLRFTRTYSSRFVAGGSFGRGWASWATTVCLPQPDGSFAYHGPDGQMAVVVGQRVSGLEATLDATDDGGVVVAWDIHSGRPGQRWTFAPDGTLTSVSGPMVGTTTFAYRGGLLVAMTHDGGRRLDIDWDVERGRIVAVHSSCGRSTLYQYNEANDLVQTRRALGDRCYDVDDRGRIVAVFDADGVRLCHNTFDDEGRVLRQVSPYGRETVFDYRPGRLTVVSDTTDGPVTIYRHDATGRLVGLANDLGQHLDRSFDNQGRCESSRGFDGSLITQSFDPEGRVSSVEGPGGYLESWEYDDAGRVVAHADASGGRMTFAYFRPEDEFPNRVDGPDGWSIALEMTDGVLRSMTDADGVTMGMEYDGDGNVVAVTNGVGDVTRYTHHPSGEAASVITAEGAVFRMEHDDAGRLLAMHAPSGDIWRVEYTAAGRRSALIEPNGARITYEYGSHGGVERLVDALGAAIEMHHDHLEQLVGMTMADGAKWDLSYGVMGQLAMVTDPTGATWLYDHDAEGRLTAATDPLGHRMRQSYDAAGRLTAVIDRSGNITRYTHDGLGRPTEVEDPTGATATFDRDSWGRVLSVTDGDGNETRYAYTPAGRLREAVSQEGRRLSYAYDGAGRLESVADGEGATTTYEWDSCDRVVAVIDTEGRERRTTYDSMGRAIAVSMDGRTWRYGYDHAGRVTSVTDPAGGVTRYQFDRRGKPQSATDALGNTVQWRYDARGNAVGVIDPLGGVVTTTFDAMRRPVATTDQAGRTTRIERDAAGRVTAWVLPTRERREYRLDPRGLVMDVFVDGQNLVVYERDRAGRPVLVHEPNVNRTYAVSWSPGGRIERIDCDGVRLGPHQSRRVQPRLDRADVRYRHDAAGQLVSAVGPDGAWTWRYDASGRMASEEGPDGVRTFLYDDVHQLVRIDGPAGTTLFRYDAAGRRIVEDGPSGVTRYRWDGLGRLREIDRSGRRIDLDVDAFGDLVRVGNVPLAWDPSGLISELLTIGGDEPEAAEGPTDPWGHRADADGPVVRLGFLGEVEVGGLVWLRHRCYDPATRQFLSPDPLPGIAGTPTACNPYHYAFNDPIGFVDPLGLQPLSIEQYNEIRERETGPQWGTIAMLGLTAASFLIPGVGPLAAIAIGAGIGALMGAAPGVINGIQTGEWDWGQIARGGVVGGVVGGVGGRFLPGSTSFVNAVARGGALGFGAGAGNEALDLLPIPGSDGSFDPETVALSTAFGAGGSGLGFRMTRTTAYRVEGPGNARLAISPGGDVNIQGNRMLFMNFGDRARAQQFLATRLSQGFDDTVIKSAVVRNSYVNRLRDSAVPEPMARQFPDSPLVVDVTKAADQFGLRSSHFPDLLDNLIPGSGRVH